MDSDQIQGVVRDSMTRFFFASRPTPRYRALKPYYGLPRYVDRDSKPTVVLRARLRLGCALTPRRHYIYRHVPSPNCDCGGGFGDTHHVILHCPKFATERSLCVDALHLLYVPVELTVDLALGEPPPAPPNRSLRGEKAFLRSLHDQCLHITGLFLQAIDRKIIL